MKHPEKISRIRTIYRVQLTKRVEQYFTLLAQVILPNADERREHCMAMITERTREQRQELLEKVKRDLLSNDFSLLEITESEFWTFYSQVFDNIASLAEKGDQAFIGWLEKDWWAGQKEKVVFEPAYSIKSDVWKMKGWFNLKVKFETVMDEILREVRNKRYRLWKRMSSSSRDNIVERICAPICGHFLRKV